MGALVTKRDFVHMRPARKSFRAGRLVQAERVWAGCLMQVERAWAGCLADVGMSPTCWFVQVLSQTSTFGTFFRCATNKPVHWGRFRALRGAKTSRMYWFVDWMAPQCRGCTGLWIGWRHTVLDVLVCGLSGATLSRMHWFVDARGRWIAQLGDSRQCAASARASKLCQKW